MIQPNMSEKEDWTAEEAAKVRDNLVKYTVDAVPRNGAQLVIWPEVPGPIYYYHDPVFRDEATVLARSTRAYFLFGTVGETAKREPLNSAVLLNPNGDFVDRYDKINLVPFGEFVPRLFGWVNRITKEAGDFAPGSRVVVFPLADHKIGAFICYESAFPDLVREFARGGAEMLVNLSNDGYFGRSAAREQHLALVRMRAAENRRWILRATNDGITASIDPAGRITYQAPPYRELAAAVTYRYLTNVTPYTRYGDWFAWSCLVAGLLMTLWPRMNTNERE
jgi:apolipoprotein N-acyltransferase